MIPPDPELRDDPDELLDIIDGLILAGGADIDPSAYGAEAHPETKGTVPERDDFEIALARRALDRDTPLLGICRGMQLMNVARGGTLEQHLPESHGHHDHRMVSRSAWRVLPFGGLSMSVGFRLSTPPALCTRLSAFA